MFAPPQEELDHAGFTPPEEELDEAPKKELAPEGFWGTAGRELASKIAPAAGAAAGGLGAGLLAIESGPGAIAADIAAGTAAGAGTEALQRKVMGDEWSDQNIAQMEANAKAHPHAAMIGSALPFILSALGGGVPRALKSGAEKVGAGLGEKVAAGELAENVAKDQTAAAFKKAEESFLPSATQFARAGGASEAEKQVDTDKFDPASLAGETGMGFATGGLMHFIPAADLKNPETWGKFAKEALYSVTGKAAGDATTMVVANKAYDHFVNGKPFDMSDVVGDSAAATLDFALLNALHVGIASKGFGKVMADRTKQNELQSQKDQSVSKAADLAEGVNPELAPETSQVVNEIVAKAATAPTPQPEVAAPQEGEAPIPEVAIPPLSGGRHDLLPYPPTTPLGIPEDEKTIDTAGFKNAPIDRTETPSNASQPPSAVITPETPSDTLEALERAKEQVSWDLTPEERSQIEAMVRKRHAGKPPQVVDELAEDAVQATRRSALSQKYARKFQEIAEQIKGISGPGKAPEPSTEPGNFPSAPERADLAKRQPAPKEKAVSEAEPPRIEGASFQDSEGKVHTAGDHVTAAALAGVEAPMDRPGRETAPYGFKLENQEKPLSRKEATELVRGTKPTTSGKAKPHPQYRSGKEVGGRRKLLHSNEVRMEHQMSLKEVPEFREEISGKEPIPSQAKFEAAYQKDFLKDHGETREEFLNRKICGG